MRNRESCQHRNLDTYTINIIRTVGTKTSWARAPQNPLRKNTDPPPPQGHPTLSGSETTDVIAIAEPLTRVPDASERRSRSYKNKQKHLTQGNVLQMDKVITS